MQTADNLRSAAEGSKSDLVVQWSSGRGAWRRGMYVGTGEHPLRRNRNRQTAFIGSNSSSSQLLEPPSWAILGAARCVPPYIPTETGPDARWQPLHHPSPRQ